MAPASILFHESQFPNRIEEELYRCLESGAVNTKFLYDSPAQTSRWLALHQVCSASRTDPRCIASYQSAFDAARTWTAGKSIHLCGVGCGGGKKDATLLRTLSSATSELHYTAIDVSPAMVLTAASEAAGVISCDNCSRVVCDLAQAPDLRQVLDGLAPEGPKLFTFFGMIPNFVPSMILPLLRAWIRAGDLLLFSANLAPGEDPFAGTRGILPQYDNPHTREWLNGFLTHVGLPPGAGEISFDVQETYGLPRVTATFEFREDVSLRLHQRTLAFKSGAKLLLFYSFRYTPSTARELLEKHGLMITGQWMTEEEGVFAVQLQ